MNTGTVQTIAWFIQGGILVEVQRYSSMTDAMLALDPFCNVWGACAVAPYDVEPVTLRSAS